MNTGGLTAGWGCMENVGSELPAADSLLGPLLLLHLPEALALSLPKKEDMTGRYKDRV